MHGYVPWIHASGIVPELCVLWIPHSVRNVLTIDKEVMEYHLAVSVPDKAKDVMDIEVTAEGVGDKRRFSFAAFWRLKFLENLRLGDFITRLPSLLYYDLGNVFSKVGV